MMEIEGEVRKKNPEVEGLPEAYADCFRDGKPFDVMVL